MLNDQIKKKSFKKHIKKSKLTVLNNQIRNPDHDIRITS